MSNGREPTVLVVEDDGQTREGMGRYLRAQGFEVVEAATCDAAVSRCLAERPDVVVTDFYLPDGEALGLIPQLLRIDPKLPVLVLTGLGSIDLAVRALKEGAENFLTKPTDLQVLAQMLREQVEARRRRETTAEAPSLSFGSSPAMCALARQVESLRDSDCPVLIRGETGTGKTTLARFLHEVGPRSKQAFVDVNCGALSRELVESELFGHERGAFTGAAATKRGLFEAADGGTLFLDEIGDIDVAVQPKVLKVVEEKRFRRLGDVKERSADVRLIAATHRDLTASIREKTFRSDLYYRIATVCLTVPALRDRREDLPALARQLLGQIGERRGSPEVELGRDAEEVLCRHSWPGNIRELRNVLERALLRFQRGVVRAWDIEFDPVDESVPRSSSQLTLKQMERDAIELALREEGGRVDAAAKRLGIPRSTLYQKVKVYGLTTSRI